MNFNFSKGELKLLIKSLKIASEYLNKISSVDFIKADAMGMIYLKQELEEKLKKR